ncbi:MAG: alginate lyase family protein [Kofleriaceae bacterium]|nr:alginate lyase family protein [Kofleriaceae bacterium]
MNVRWYASRLRAMSIAEVAHRCYRAMRSLPNPRPSAAMRAHIARWQGPEPFYFARALCATPVSSALLGEAALLCAGKRRVLGLGWLDVPAERWHYEPRADGYWPRVDAARVVRAAPPQFDPRLTWELNRGHDWVVLARVHASTRDARCRDRLVRELGSWRRANPLGVGINWVSAMEAAIRIHSLVWCAAFLRGTSVAPVLGEMIYEHAVVVSEQLSAYSSANNHLIVELSALVIAARALGGDLAGLHADAFARLCSELDRQVHADGVSAEMATHYHVFVLEALVLVAYLERAHGMARPRLEAVIRKMADYVAAIRCDDGSLLQQGDDDGGCVLGLFRPCHTDQVLAAATALSSPARQTGQGFEGSFFVTGGAQPPGESRAPRSRRFVRSGQIILRSARLHAAFDAGPFGFGSLAAHAHCDALAITLALDGRRILVDRGTCRYSGDRRERDYYRRTAAHNTTQPASLEQASATGPFLWSRRPRLTIHRCDLMEDGDIVQASHDGFPGWAHRRTLVRHHGVLLIVDELVGTGAPTRIVSRFHFAPELDVMRSQSDFWVRHGNSSRAWLRSSAGHARVVLCGHSDEYASSTTAATVELADTSDRALITAIGPADESLDALLEFAADNGFAREMLLERLH